MREIKSITGLRVISVEEGASVGTVSQVVVDLTKGVLLGLIVGDGLGERGVPAESIQTLGADVVMVSSRAVARPLSELPELVAHRETTPAPLPIFTASGKRLGIVTSIFIDPYDRVVTRYEVSSGPLKDLSDGMLILPILPGTVHGQDAVIVPDEQVAQLGREAGGWRERVGHWTEAARKQAQQVSESAGKLVESGGEVVKKEAQVAREKAAQLSGSAGEAVKKEAQIVREKAAKLVESGSEVVKKEAQVAREKAAQFSGTAGEAVKLQAQAAREKAAKLVEDGGEAVKKEAQVVREKAADLSAKGREAVTKLTDKEDAAPEAEQAPVPPADDVAAAKPTPKKSSAKKSSPKHEPTES